MADANGQSGAPVPTFEETNAALQRFVKSGSSADLEIYRKGEHLMDPNYAKTLKTKAATDLGESIADRGGVPLPPKKEVVPKEDGIGTAPSGAADRADAAPVGGAGLTSGVDSVIYQLRKVQKAIESSTGEQKVALEAHAKVLKGQVEEEAGKQQEMADRADRRVRGMKLMTQRHDEATARAEAEIRNAERMVTSQEIDPNRAFKTTGARVGSAIAIAMSALGQGMSGRAGPNTAYKIINDAINRDIDLQKEELRTRKDVMRNKNNLYANMMAKFGNERSAELATAKAGIDCGNPEAFRL
jgi:hypothetical protein